MESEVIDKKEISEEYTTANGKRTRTHTIRTMVNNGSKFVNYRCGKQSVNISKNMFEQIQQLKLQWEGNTNNTNESKIHAENVSLQKQLNELKALIKASK